MSDRATTLTDQLKRIVTGEQYRNGRVNDTIVLGAIVAFVLALPYASDLLLDYTGIASNILIWMLFALAFNILLGYTGLLSFGHAMFLGGGMYVVAITMSEISSSLFLPSILAAVCLSGAVAYLIGRLIVERGEIYFALLTIAFAEVAWYVVNSDPGGYTGGDDGISSGILPSFVETFRGEIIIAVGGLEFSLYWGVGLVFALGVFLLYRIVTSPFGRTLITIRENQQLARSIGIDVKRYKVHAFVISAMFTALAGTMLVIVNQSVATDYLFWETSGQVVMMSIVGGISSFIGPMFGAILWIVGEEFLSSWEFLGELRHYWNFAFGVLFVAVILRNPKGGAWGVLKDSLRWITARLGGDRRE